MKTIYIAFGIMLLAAVNYFAITAFTDSRNPTHFPYVLQHDSAPFIRDIRDEDGEVMPSYSQYECALTQGARITFVQNVGSSSQAVFKVNGNNAEVKRSDICPAGSFYFTIDLDIVRQIVNTDSLNGQVINVIKIDT